jgi:hypothetical protein
MMSFEFIERYTSLNKTSLGRSSQSESKTKIGLTGKQRRVNMDDTESEGEDHNGDYDAEKPWLAEWNRYEKTHEAVPESMGIVRWWGVCAHSFNSALYTDAFISSMHIGIRRGHRLLETTLLLWRHQSLVSGPFQLRESP